ncbi:hypothetical protein GCM10023074_39600 [Microbispora amethystogenes]|uniref:Uncharacterized protein n=1 Tax=Microbispora amethystogenes TaxID=1427754 RepID=A0ABQ4FCZ2_9ACTN|nr:hypothetical protein Mam01_28040 [Microbispora amethystogenes]
MAGARGRRLTAPEHAISRRSAEDGFPFRPRVPRVLTRPRRPVCALVQAPYKPRVRLAPGAGRGPYTGP